MTLGAGTRLGPYEIVAPLGAGGMGEVYRARDARLSREVAVKILSSHRTPTPEARERFEREARTISQLTHPNVCVLHDVGRDGDVEYLVMELVEGETLTDRLGRGPLPLEQSLRIGAEIGAALGAAHGKGIVHRDLKPGNVMLTKSGVKLLDFGLARAFEAPVALSGLTEAPTVGRHLTAEGTIVGTLAYMAPEQLEGKQADPRTDIFALGAVLYEMLTGRPAFSGASPATLISSILTSEPAPVSTLAPVAPPELDRLVRTCLAKDPADRWQSAHDVELQLRSIGSGSGASAAPSVAPGRRRARLPWVIAAVCVVIAAAALIRGGVPKPARAGAVRFSILPPEKGAFEYSVEDDFLGISPDGSQLAYLASDPKGGHRVWVRPVWALEARPIPGTEDARSLMWSPDGRFLAFFTSDKLKRVDLAGGAAVSICDMAASGGGGRAGTWGRSDILFTNVQGGEIYRVPASGGRPVAVMRVESARGEMRFAWPLFLPDGERFLYLVRRREGWGDLMLAETGKAPRSVMQLASFFQYLDPGYLVFSREGTLVAQRFNAKDGRLSGEPIPIAEHVRYFYSTASAAFAARARTIAYQAGEDAHRLVWYDFGGREVGSVGPPGGYMTVSLTPDGRRLFFDRTRKGLDTFHVWSYDLERGVESPITQAMDTEAFPLLLSDGKSLVYSAVRGSAPMLQRLDLSTGKEVPLASERRSFQIAQDVSPDGRTLVYTERGDGGSFDVWTLPLDEPGKPKLLLQSPFEKGDVRFSPDGRFLALLSTESGRPEAYVVPYPGPGEKVRVSEGGAQLLRWARGGQLYYLTGDRRFVAVAVRTTPSLQIGAATTLFQLSGKAWLSFDVAADGKRLLAVVPDISGDESPVNVVLNWPGDAAK